MKAVIICDGELAEINQILNAVSAAELLIAADGGANRAFELNLEPDFIVGDLDSYAISGNETAQIVYDPDQETNDLEKALQLAKKEAAEQVIIFGATGKRLDQTLKNLSVLLQFDTSFQSILFKDRFSDISVITSPYKHNFPLNTSISLFPISGTVENITTRGLKYPLQNGILKNGVQDGSSNETVEKTVEIVFKKGDLLLLVNHKSA